MYADTVHNRIVLSELLVVNNVTVTPPTSTVKNELNVI
jgi:hypothetical protein